MRPYSILTGIALAAFAAACSDAAERTHDGVQTDSAAAATAPAPQATSVRQLPVDSFPNLPMLNAAAFATQGCSVPQAFEPATPHNVIEGEFAARGQSDWAALCVRGDSAAIVVVWGGPVNCPSVLAWSQNANYMQNIGSDTFAFSRVIGSAGPAMVRQRWQQQGGPAPPSIDHAGIEDAFLEKASTLYYCTGGIWVQLAGSD